MAGSRSNLKRIKKGGRKVFEELRRQGDKARSKKTKTKKGKKGKGK